MTAEIRALRGWARRGWAWRGSAWRGWARYGPGPGRGSRVPGAPPEPISARLGRRTAGVREEPQDGLPARSLRRADSGEVRGPIDAVGASAHLPAPERPVPAPPVAGPAAPGDDAGVEVGPTPEEPALRRAQLRDIPGVDLLPALLVCALIVAAVLLSGCKGKPDPPTCRASTVAQWNDDPRSQDPDVGYWACVVPTAHAGEYR